MHEAGRELDAIVHKLLGRKPYSESRQLCDAVVPYSTNITAAWVVWERLLAQPGWTGSIYRDSAGEYICTVGVWHTHTKGTTFVGVAETAPLAICRAALKIRQSSDNT